MIQPANHWLFQLGMLFLLLSYITSNIISLRATLAIASLFLSLWGALVLDVSLDTTLWNVLFFLINSLHALYLLSKKRPIKFSNSAHERIYQEMFAKVGVSRHDFKCMANVGFLRSLKAGSYYIESGNVVNNLSLFYKGKLELYKNRGKRVETINICEEWEFVESPEWAARIHRKKTTDLRVVKRASDVGVGDEENPCILFEEEGGDTTINVSVKAIENSFFLSWPVEELENFFEKFPHMAAPFNAVVGADVAKKLFRSDSDLPKQKRASTQYTDDERFLRGVFLTSLPESERFDMEELISSSKLTTSRLVGTVYVRAGEEMTHLCVLKTGEMEAVVGEGENERVVFVIKPPQFIGAMEYTTENHIAPLTIRTRTPCTYCEWEARDLRQLCTTHPSLHHTLTSAFAVDLCVKINNGLIQQATKNEHLSSLEPHEQKEENHT